MGSELLMDIQTLDGDTNLSTKAESRIGIQISSNDGLPPQICKTCKEMVVIFFRFKQKCLEVDLKLRALASSQLTGSRKFHRRSYTQNKNLNICSQTPNHNHIVTDIESTKGNTNNLHLTSQRLNKWKTQKKFQCEICGRIFKIKAMLENHLITHSGLKPFQCKLCPKRYCRHENLTIHMRSHAGIKPYICEICGKTSTKRQDLIRHMKIHSDERNYACPRCDRNFKRASDSRSSSSASPGQPRRLKAFL